MGRKSENEKFAGALRTYSIEGLMGDGKALQAGTSHNLGENFARSFDIQYLDSDKQRKYCATVSWGASTRLIGAVIMTHGDNAGLIMPPRVAPVQVVIVPIWRKEAEKSEVAAMVEQLTRRLKALNIRFKADWREETPGWKYNEWELRGVPVRMEVGPRDVKNNSVVLVRRDNRAKEVVPVEALNEKLPWLMAEIQSALYDRALKFRQENTREVSDYEEFKRVIADHKGFVKVRWTEDTVAELKIKEDTKATLRNVPLDQSDFTPGPSLLTGKPADCYAYFARAY